MTLKEDVEHLKYLVEQNKLKGVEEKKFKLPFGKKVGGGQKKKNFATVLLLNENGSYEFKKYKIEDQTIIHDLIPRLATSKHVNFDKKGNPLVILPNWSVEPFSSSQNFSESIENGSNVNGYKLLMAKMQKEMVSPKKSMGGFLPWIIGFLVIAAIAYYFLSGGSKTGAAK